MSSSNFLDNISGEAFKNRSSLNIQFNNGDALLSELNLQLPSFILNNNFSEKQIIDISDSTKIELASLAFSPFLTQEISSH